MPVFFAHHRSIFFPTLLILIGVLAILTNLEILSVTIWEWWPLLFVLVGLYIFVWQRKRKSLLKGLMWYGAIHKLLKNEKVEKLLESEKIKKELKKIGTIAEGVITEQIDKLHKKYKKKK